MSLVESMVAIVLRLWYWKQIWDTTKGAKEATSELARTKFGGLQVTSGDQILSNNMAAYHPRQRNDFGTCHVIQSQDAHPRWKLQPIRSQAKRVFMGNLFTLPTLHEVLEQATTRVPCTPLKMRR